MYTYEVAPVATLMEKALIEKMLSFTGWEQGEGIFTSVGSQSNLYAMLLARNATFPVVKTEGISTLPKLAILVSERSHFSLLKGANTIGIGHNGVVKVKVDERGRMRGAAVTQALEETLKKGMVPFMVCSTAGTTETGSFDAIDEKYGSMDNFLEKEYGYDAEKLDVIRKKYLMYNDDNVEPLEKPAVKK